MAKIELPSKNSSEDVEGKGTEKKDTPADDVVNKIAALADEMGVANKERREKEAAKEKEAEDDRAKSLAAETDLKALMESGDVEVEIPEAGKTRKQQVDDMSNSEVLDVVATAVDTAVGARLEQASKEIDEKFKTTAGAMSKIIELLGRMQAATGMSEIRGKYDDFDKFKEDTLSVLKKYPMMDIEDAYLLAHKLREGDNPPANQTEFERPVNVPFDRGAERSTSGGEETGEREGKPKSSETHGIVGFRNFMGKALDKRFGT